MLLIRISALLAVVRTAYDYGPLVPMSEYDKEYRVLSCWECFEAQGKICRNVDNTS
jgi:hypothetical protein